MDDRDIQGERFEIDYWALVDMELQRAVDRARQKPDELRENASTLKTIWVRCLALRDEYMRATGADEDRRAA